MDNVHRDGISPRARLREARMIDTLLAEASAPRPPVHGIRSLVERAVAAAVEPSLASVSGILRDASVPVSEDAASRLRTFLHEGAESPLYGSDVAAAQRAAREIASAFVLPAISFEHRQAA